MHAVCQLGGQWTKTNLDRRDVSHIVRCNVCDGGGQKKPRLTQPNLLDSQALPHIQHAG